MKLLISLWGLSKCMHASTHAHMLTWVLCSDTKMYRLPLRHTKTQLVMHTFTDWHTHCVKEHWLLQMVSSVCKQNCATHSPHTVQCNKTQTQTYTPSSVRQAEIIITVTGGCMDYWFRATLTQRRHLNTLTLYWCGQKETVWAERKGYIRVQ